MTEDDISVGEIARRLTRIEGKLDQQLFVTQDVYKAEKQAAMDARAAQNERINKLEDSQTWAFRMMAAAFIGLIVEGAVLALKVTS